MHWANTHSEGKLPDQSNHVMVFELETSEDDERPVRIVGNFNHWQLELGAIRMKKQGPGKYRGEIAGLRSLPSPLEYRYLKGGWDDVELDEYGSLSHPREIEKPEDTPHVKDQVLHWMKNGTAYKEQHLPEIIVLSEAFQIPQLIRTRRIAALLPHDYDRTDKSYPVLYLQDGQNLFDDYAPFGNWGVDKKLAALAGKGLHELIVVAIDHAHEQRISEFTPSHHTKLGHGEGEKYARFMVETLKPYVDRRFRTLRGREFTGIGGSSMGGLVSLYTGLLYPQFFSKMMIFSPSLWVDPDILTKTSSLHAGASLKMYLYAGGKEGGSLMSHTKNIKQIFDQKSQNGWPLRIKTSFNAKGRHNEFAWGVEFPKAVEWLYFEERMSQKRIG